MEVRITKKHFCDLSNKHFPLLICISLVGTFCEGKSDGFYRNPRDCNAFYQCLRGTASERHCLKGMEYNPLLKSCDKPENFPCPLAKNGFVSSTNPKLKESFGHGIHGNDHQSFDLLKGLLCDLSE